MHGRTRGGGRERGVDASRLQAHPRAEQRAARNRCAEGGDGGGGGGGGNGASSSNGQPVTPTRPVEHPAFDPFRRDDPPFRAADIPIRALCVVLLPLRLALAATCIVGIYLAHLLLGSALPDGGGGGGGGRCQRR